MTIYTDQVTGRQYDRIPGGVVGRTVKAQSFLSCRDCAFHADFKQCARVAPHCRIHAPGKTVFFVFKERKA